jgi:MFS family permease
MNNETVPTFKFIWLLSYISIASVSSAIITPALPTLKTHFSLSNGAVEWIVSAFLIGYVGGQLIYGPLANQYGRLKALRIGLKINLLGIIICLISVLINNFGFLIFGRFITALGAASGLSCTYMLINEWLPESQRKTAMAYSVLSFALGIGISVVLGGLITEYWNWHGCFWLLLVHGITMLWGTGAFSETLESVKPINTTTILRDYGLALSSSKLVIYSLVVSCCTSVTYCFSAAGPQIAHSLLNLSAATYAYWNGLNILGMLLGGLIAKQLLARFSMNQVSIIGFLGIALCIGSVLDMWLIYSHSAFWFFLTTASMFLFSSLLFAVGSFVASNALADKASASSMMSFVNMGFGTLCVILMGYLSPNPLLDFIIILCLVWILVVSLVLYEG